MQALRYNVFCKGFSVWMHLCPKLLCGKVFCAQWFFGFKRPLSDSKSFLACRRAEMSGEELRGDETG